MRASLIMILLVLFVGCSKPEPITLGFVGGLTGRTADLGGHSRNGMILAIEEVNANGGIHDQPVQYLIKDDKQNADRVKAMVQELIDAKVDGIIGPSTSSMAVQVAGLSNAAKIPMFGTTVTTNELTGIDDYFFRTVSASQRSTHNYVKYLVNKDEIKNYAIVIDLSNKAYTQSWQTDFAKAMDEANVEQLFSSTFTSGDNIGLLDVSQQLALLETDLIVLVTNATDAALLFKQIRSINQTVQLAVSEWAGTQQLIQLAGADAEGAWVPRYIDIDSGDAQFITFSARYQERFKQQLSYPSLLGYNSTIALLNGLKNKTSDEDLKSYILNQKVFPSVLADFELNEYGDEISNAFHFITYVKNGAFVTVRN